MTSELGTWIILKLEADPFWPVQWMPQQRERRSDRWFFVSTALYARVTDRHISSIEQQTVLDRKQQLIFTVFNHITTHLTPHGPAHDR